MDGDFGARETRLAFPYHPEMVDNFLPSTLQDNSMPADNVIDPGLLDILRCPISGLLLKIDGDNLVSTDGSKQYPVVAGIPCLMPDSAKPTHAGYRFLVEENRKQRHASVTETKLLVLFRR